MDTCVQFCILLTLLSPKLASTCLDGKFISLYTGFFLIYLRLCIIAQEYQKNIVAQEYQHFCAYSFQRRKKTSAVKKQTCLILKTIEVSRAFTLVASNRVRSIPFFI